MTANQRRSSPSRHRNRHRPRDRRKATQTSHESEPKTAEDTANEESFEHIKKRYAVLFYETFEAAKDDSAKLLETAQTVEQLNIVVHAEGPMDDPELLQYGKLYAGEAWTIIHKRRVEEGWYQEPH